ncbi:MAG: hypothetical protein GXP49_12830 [Deltaproteobacteria bacterium]|nr:hypothetical protein [Deltaproteobacteria bacterium]
MNRSKMDRSTYLWIVFGSIVIMLGKGLFFLHSNQHQYFLLGLRLSDPGFLPKDWFTWHTTHYHQAFGYLLWLLNLVGPLKVTTLAAQFGLTLLLCFGLVVLSRTIAGAGWRLVFMASVLWIAIASIFDMDLGFLNFFSGYLQPSEVAAAFLVAGVALFATDRMLAAGILTGLSGLFHGSFLLSLSPVVAVLALVRAKDLGLRKTVSFLLPVALLWGINVTFVLWARAGMSSVDDRFLNILFHFRSPHHYDVSYWPLAQIAGYFLFAVLGGIALLMIYLKNRQPGLKVLLAAGVTSIIVTTLGMLAVMIHLNKTITLAVPWRIGPLAFLLGLMALIHVFDKLGNYTNRSSVVKTMGKVFARTGILAAGGFWAWRAPKGLESLLRFGWLAFVPACNALKTWMGKKGITFKPVLSVELVLAVSLASGAAYNGLKNRSNIFKANQPKAIELVEPVKNMLPKDAVLVVPPTADFVVLRILARRALVVDFKCFPVVPSQIKEWYKRLSDVCGISGAAPPWRFLLGYLNMDTNRAVMLRRLYGATHVIVFSQGHRGDLSGMEEVVKTRHFRIYKIP